MELVSIEKSKIGRYGISNAKRDESRRPGNCEAAGAVIQ